jgi:hypothetical protein
MNTEYLVLTAGAVAAGVFVFRDAIFGTPSRAPTPVPNGKARIDEDDRDFVRRMKAGVSTLHRPWRVDS